MRHAALAVLSAALLASCDRSPTAPHTGDPSRAAAGAQGAAAAAAASTKPAAFGSATILFGPNREKLAFHAELRNGVATGHARFNNTTAHVKGQIDVNCLVIVGNIARISGIVTKSNDPTIEGFEALFQVQDNGEGHPSADLASTVMLHEVGVGPNCQAPGEIDMVPITHGNIQVRP